MQGSIAELLTSSAIRRNNAAVLSQRQTDQPASLESSLAKGVRIGTRTRSTLPGIETVAPARDQRHDVRVLPLMRAAIKVGRAVDEHLLFGPRVLEVPSVPEIVEQSPRQSRLARDPDQADREGGLFKGIRDQLPSGDGSARGGKADHEAPRLRQPTALSSPPPRCSRTRRSLRLRPRNRFQYGDRYSAANGSPVIANRVIFRPAMSDNATVTTITSK